MSIADILISLITWIVQKIILPVLPMDLPFLPLNEFAYTLHTSSLLHNVIYSFSGLTAFFNLKLVFTLLISIIAMESLAWLIRVAFFVIKIIRG